MLETTGHLTEPDLVQFRQEAGRKVFPTVSCDSSAFVRRGGFDLSGHRPSEVGRFGPAQEGADILTDTDRSRFVSLRGQVNSVANTHRSHVHHDHISHH